MRYALVVPALNEEQAIAGTLRRALAARDEVCARTPVTEVAVVFVNDGSTDRTQEIVDQPEFDEVVKVRFKRNRGYGAAIKAGWRATDADLLGFIDGDGTCDPNYSVHLINRMLETNADVVLAGRMNSESEMPVIRKLGNLLFARLLNVVSHSKITDCASGFRVVRRASLRYLSPLPNGLHFTPAMSAICLLDPRLRIEEVPMPYKERIGRSKLSVVRDGLRFLYIILFTVCCYNPVRTMLAVAGLWLMLSFGLAGVARMWGAHGLSQVFGVTGAVVSALCVWAGVICHQLNFLLIGPRRRVGWAERALQSLTEYKLLIISGLGTLAAGLLMLVVSNLEAVAPTLSQLASGVVMIFGALAALSGVVLRVVWAVGEKQRALLNEGPWGEPLSSALVEASLGGGSSVTSTGRVGSEVVA